jgi:hypothetical protein
MKALAEKIITESIEVRFSSVIPRKAAGACDTE